MDTESAEYSDIWSPRVGAVRKFGDSARAHNEHNGDGTDSVHVYTIVAILAVLAFCLYGLYHVVGGCCKKQKRSRYLVSTPSAGDNYAMTSMPRIADEWTLSTIPNTVEDKDDFSHPHPHSVTTQNEPPQYWRL